MFQVFSGTLIHFLKSARNFHEQHSSKNSVRVHVFLVFYHDPKVQGDLKHFIKIFLEILNNSWIDLLQKPHWSNLLRRQKAIQTPIPFVT